ncbi:MAG: UDP-N-acetylmuramoyl-L-alanyl-D-glutamate--2,6-diaminopimelate ligase [Synechococcus sp.]
MSKALNDLLALLSPAAHQFGISNNPSLTGVTTNSKVTQPGNLFIGMPGTRTDGGRFWQQAADKGAVAAFISQTAFRELSESAAKSRCSIPIFSWPDDHMIQVCGQSANWISDFPAKSLSLIGVTGTNGKTTITHIIEHLLNANSPSTALIGTLYERWPGHSVEAAHTTPFAPEMQRSLASAMAAGCDTAVMEVSSHSLDQNRVWGCTFDAAVWTNLTQDHLDYHSTMEEYWAAKAKLFQPPYFAPTGRAVLNVDDEWVTRLVRSWPSDRLPPWGFTLQSEPNLPDWALDRLLWASDVLMDATQTRALLHTPAGDIPVTAPLVGRFNLANLLAAVGVALHLGVGLDTIQSALPTFPGVPGRVAPVQIPGQDIAVVIDYAHTPDGLQNLLDAMRPSVQNSLVCVFGCGGDRDRRKRPLMGDIAARLSDAIVVTSDNPRTEDPQQILEDIMTGVNSRQSQVEIEIDRKKAIYKAILSAQPGDTVAIAGKGHETYQILGRLKVHFDDREVAEAALRQRLSQSVVKGCP